VCAFGAHLIAPPQGQRNTFYGRNAAVAGRSIPWLAFIMSPRLSDPVEVLYLGTAPTGRTENSMTKRLRIPKSRVWHLYKAALRPVRSREFSSDLLFTAGGEMASLTSRKTRNGLVYPRPVQLANQTRDLTPFNFAIDSKLRGCDLVSLRVRDLGECSRIFSRAVVMQQKTKRPVQCEITEGTRQAIVAWIGQRHFRNDDFAFPSRVRSGGHLGTRQ
jgi:integrase